MASIKQNQLSKPDISSFHSLEYNCVNTWTAVLTAESVPAFMQINVLYVYTAEFSTAQATDFRILTYTQWTLL